METRTDGDVTWAKTAGNSIGFLRLALAALVVFSHSYDLGGFGMEPLRMFSRARQSFGDIAVAGFFLLSGWLITQSYVRSPSLWRFLWHRALRILPAYWVCLCVVAVIIGPLFYLIERGSIHGYFRPGPGGPVGYVTSNWLLTLNQQTIDDLGGHLPFPYVLDGSLWTLHSEAMCYIAVFILGAIGVLTRGRLIAVLLTVALWVLYAVTAIHGPVVPPAIWLTLRVVGDPVHNLEQWTFFGIGSSAWLYRDRLQFGHYGGSVALLVSAIALAVPLTSCILPITLSYTLFWLAMRLPFPFTRVGRHVDLSYGLYIYAFAIQQLLSFLGLNRYGLPIYLVLAFVAVLPLAMLSWQMIESPCLSLKEWTPRFAYKRGGTGGRSSEAIGARSHMTATDTVP